MKYDAGMYAGIAQSLYEKGEYSYNGVRGDLPPIFPFMLAIALIFGEGAIDFVTPITAILLGISAFLLLSLHGRREYAFFIALLIVTNPAVFEYSLGHFRDVPILFFTFMVYYLYEQILRNQGKADERPFSIAIGVFFAMAFLSSYSAILYFLPILIHATLNKHRFILPGLYASAIMILPWAIWSQINFGTPFYEHSGYLVNHLKIGSGLKYFYGNVFPTFLRFTIPLSILGFLGVINETQGNGLGLAGLSKNMYFQLAVFTILPNSIWPEQTVRYIFPALISLAYFAIRFASMVKYKHILSLLLITGIVFQTTAALRIADYNCPRFQLLEEGGLWLRENTAEDDKLIANSFYQINYFSKRVTFQLPGDTILADAIIEKNHVRFIVVDTYETTILPTPDYLEKFEPVKKFSHNREEVIIYRVNEL
jgi:hypothetical protein